MHLSFEGDNSVRSLDGRSHQSVCVYLRKAAGLSFFWFKSRSFFFFFSNNELNNEAPALFLSLRLCKDILNIHEGF